MVMRVGFISSYPPTECGIATYSKYLTDEMRKLKSELVIGCHHGGCGQNVFPGFYHDDPRLAEKWDLIIFGSEVGTAYTELVDPVIQRERFTAQSLLAAGGDPEAMELDEDFLEALEYAMPPSGGMGMGLDRLVMMLTNASIRETISFPLVRPRTL